MSQPTRVLFVCMGNICRSPTAEGVFRALLADEGLEDDFEVDSAGTHDYHIGEPVDDRTLRAAAARGVNLSYRTGRQARAADFDDFDYVIAMDRQNLHHLQRLAGGKADGRLHLMMDFAPELGMRDVPDPYFGGHDGFERVLDLVQTAARGLLDSIRRRHVT